MPMLLSSPKTHVHKVVTPIFVLGALLLAVAWTQRRIISVEPFTTLMVIMIAMGCGAWVVWRPFRLRIADVVEEIDGVLHIRRGRVEEMVPYSQIAKIEVVRIGSYMGAKLTFRTPTSLGTQIGLYLNDPDPTAVMGIDPVEHVERQIGASH
jgi:ABC-type nickel/cobalt efflux system permease component RcnA